MISAEQARKETQAAAETRISETLKRVEKNVCEAVNQGKYQCYYFGYLNDKVIMHLRNLGYEVTLYNQYNETDYTISWEAK